MADNVWGVVSATANTPSGFINLKLIDNGDTPQTFSLATAGVTGQTVRVSAGQLAKGQTAKTYVANILLTGSPQTIALGTVTTGKTQILTDIMISTSSTASLDIRLQAAAIDIFRAYVKDVAPIAAPGIETQPTGTTTQALTLDRKSVV